MLKKIMIALAAILVAMQFFRIDKTSPAGNPENDFMTVSAAPSDVAAILNNACYDCHSNTTVYPWYTNIAPVSWWIQHHVTEGRREINFSEWAGYSTRKKDHKLKEAVEQVEDNEMPMSSYLWEHGNAALSKEQKDLLIAFFNSLRTHESDKPKKE